MNKSFVFALVLSFGTWMCRPAFAESEKSNSDETVSVMAEGVGTTQENALKNAFKNAVYKAVGVYVLSETTSSNDDIKDKVFLNSDAVVKSHQIIKSTRRKGEYVIVIRAKVMKNEIAAKIQSVETTSKISQDHVLSTVNSLESVDEAAKAFHTVMADFPQNIMDIETIGEPYIDDAKSTNGDEIPMIQKIRISVNQKRYVQLMEKLKKIFGPFAKEKKNGVLEKDFIYYGNSRSYNPQFIIYLHSHIIGRKYKKNIREGGNYTAYTISADLMKKTVSRIGLDYGFRGPTYTIDYTLYDSNNQEVFFGKFSIDNRERCYINQQFGCFIRPYTGWNGGNKKGSLFALQPFFIKPGRRWYYVNSMDTFLKFTINKDDFKSIRKSSIKAVKFQARR